MDKNSGNFFIYVFEQRGKLHIFFSGQPFQRPHHRGIKAAAAQSQLHELVC